MWYVAVTMKGPSHRKQFTDEYREGTLDLMHVHFHCAKCDAAVNDRTIRAVGDVGYEDLASLQSLAAKMLASYLKETEECGTCGKPARARAGDYHVFTSGRDLVVRTYAPEGLLERTRKAELLWWDGETFVPAELTEDEQDRFARDASFRNVQSTHELQGLDGALPKLEELAGRYPGDELLMDHVPHLVQRGRTALAARILRGQLEERPDDPDANYWMAEILVRLVNSGQLEREILDEAHAHLTVTLDESPSHKPARLTMATLHRIRAQPEEAALLLEGLIADDPADELAHYNLAALRLPDDPQRALGHFQAGERLSPKDPDYPIGIARALAALGRTGEARDALARARELAPDHPRIAQVEASLA